MIGETDGLEQTLAWDRLPPERPSQGIGLLDYDTEDAVLTDLEV